VKLDSLACVFTPQGFRTERQDSIGTRVFHEFTLSADSTCLVNEDGTVKVMATWDNYIINHTAVWNMDPSLFSSEQQSLFDQLNAELKVYNANCSLASIGLGKSSGSAAVMGLVFTFYTNAAKTKTNSMGLALTLNKLAYGQIEVISTKDDAVDRNMTSINTRAGNIISLAHAFGATLNGVYDVTPNSYFVPTGALFNAVGSGNSFKLN
jgi:hypothetical protein